MSRDLRDGLVDTGRGAIAGALPAARGSRRPLVRSVRGRARRKRRLALLACVTAIASAAYGAEQEAEWIRPEAVSGRADALLTELEAARPESATQEKFDEIERSLGALAPRRAEQAAGA